MKTACRTGGTVCGTIILASFDKQY